MKLPYQTSSIVSSNIDTREKIEILTYLADQAQKANEQRLNKPKIFTIFGYEIIIGKKLNA